MSFDNNAPKANWVHSYNFQGHTVKVSDKGSIMIRTAETDRFIMCLQPKQAELLVNLSGDLANILVSEEYKMIQEQKQVIKEQAKILSQVAKETERARATVQAALDKLKISGYTEEQAKKLLGLVA